MNRLTLLALTALSLPALADEPTSGVPVVPMDDGHAVHAVVLTRDFQLTSGKLAYDHHADHPAIDHGTVVVVAVDDAMAVAKAVKNPVLYAGDVPVQLVARQASPGCLVGILPPEVDLRHAEVWFGSWELPERVDATRAAAERKAARVLGIVPRSADELARARAAGGEPMVVEDDQALYDAARALLSACPR